MPAPATCTNNLSVRLCVCHANAHVFATRGCIVLAMRLLPSHPQHPARFPVLAFPVPLPCPEAAVEDGGSPHWPCAPAHEARPVRHAPWCWPPILGAHTNTIDGHAVPCRRAEGDVIVAGHRKATAS